jgi:hypothetical protein
VCVRRRSFRGSLDAQHHGELISPGRNERGLHTERAVVTTPAEISSVVHGVIEMSASSHAADAPGEEGYDAIGAVVVQLSDRRPAHTPTPKEQAGAVYQGFARSEEISFLSTCGS